MTDIKDHKWSDPFVEKVYIEEGCFQIQLINDSGHVDLNRKDVFALAKHFGLFKYFTWALTWAAIINILAFSIVYLIVY